MAHSTIIKITPRMAVAILTMRANELSSEKFEPEFSSL